MIAPRTANRTDIAGVDLVIHQPLERKALYVERTPLMVTLDYSQRSPTLQEVEHGYLSKRQNFLPQ